MEEDSIHQLSCFVGKPVYYGGLKHFPKFRKLLEIDTKRIYPNKNAETEK